MGDKSSPTKWDRFSWNPIVPGLLLAWWFHRISRSDWDWDWLRITGVTVISLWFIGAVANVITKGKFIDWMYSDDDDEDFELPRSFTEFDEHTDQNSPLIVALRRGLAEGGDLEEELDQVETGEITDMIEAIAVLSAYRGLADADDERAAFVAPLFRNAGSPEVFGAFFQEGMPLVHGRLKTLLDRTPSEIRFDDERLDLLALLCGFAYGDAFADLARAARQPKLCESYSWVYAFQAGDGDDPDFIALLKLLGKELPYDFACVAFLDCCNSLCSDEKLDPHPFSSDAGVQRLRDYLSDDDPETFSYATSAAAALASLSHPQRDQLLALAQRHRHPNTAVEAAWAGARIGRRESIEKLAQLTSDWKTGDRALRFLRELDLEQHIPPASLEPRHLARCTMAEWLQHPHELTKLPDKLQVIDHRTIFWPPSDEKRDVTILEWISGDESGIGMAGGLSTWCFFDKETRDTPVLDVYSRHCTWEIWQSSADEDEGAAEGGGEGSDGPEDCNDVDFGRRRLQQANPDEAWAARP